VISIAALHEQVPEVEVEVEVTADKPGRYIKVERLDADDNVMLAIQHRAESQDGVDHWTWLTPHEACKLSEALMLAAMPDPEGEVLPAWDGQQPLAGRLLRLQLQQLELTCIGAKTAVAPLSPGVPEVRALLDRLCEVYEASKALEDRLKTWRRENPL
jgi:hypothetical protein